MIGRRIDSTGNGYLPKLEQPGDYGRADDGIWWAIVPVSVEEGIHPRVNMANLSLHDITEHEDGTITVAPSILLTQGDKEIYHGYLERGVWHP